PALAGPGWYCTHRASHALSPSLDPPGKEIAPKLLPAQSNLTPSNLCNFRKSRSQAVYTLGDGQNRGRFRGGTGARLRIRLTINVNGAIQLSVSVQTTKIGSIGG